MLSNGRLSRVRQIRGGGYLGRCNDGVPVPLPVVAAGRCGPTGAARRDEAAGHRPARARGRGVRGGEPVRGTVSVARRSEEHTSELQSRRDLVCRLLLEKKKKLCPFRSVKCNMKGVLAGCLASALDGCAWSKFFGGAPSAGYGGLLGDVFSRVPGRAGSG